MMSSCWWRHCRDSLQQFKQKEDSSTHRKSLREDGVFAFARRLFQQRRCAMGDI